MQKSLGLNDDHSLKTHINSYIQKYGSANTKRVFYLLSTINQARCYDPWVCVIRF
jgi:hypothetical protein